MPPHRKTCRRYNTPGHAHSLTFSCFRRQPFLTGDRGRRWLADAIRLAREKHSFELWAWVIMPEHVHLVIFPREPVYSISKILGTIKQSVVRRAVPHVRLHAPSFLPRMLDQQPNGRSHYRFWQRGGGYDRNLNQPATVWHEIGYPHANPVRRGLCDRPELWAWSSAREYLGLEPGPLSIDRASIPLTEGG